MPPGKKIAALHNDGGVLDLSSTRLMQFKQPPTADQASRAAFSKSALETPMLRMMRNLQHLHRRRHRPQRISDARPHP